ncbi:hypothetical protein HUT06_05165 [Actinomadura sp. NAK00032]|uniref:DUF5994 family protein n=1 Tax=Actinomadura sp. NAK00032 TaxID=2742128 RepID=UPI0015917415|nr:DUF5994 family protein [Actinomadura sp. NAK00032]QKW33492.1 hypothetical protein HUT06_05165 [Actinomadura sp. NAK00032]
MARVATQRAFPFPAATPLELPAPPAPRLRLVPGGTGRGIMDGGWWPRSRDADAELTGLLTALARADRLPDRVTRVAIDFDDWDDSPLRISVLGREVRVHWLAHLDHMVAITCGRADPLLLLVVPPGTRPSAAKAALARSVVEAGDVMPQEILASCDISTVRA